MEDSAAFHELAELADRWGKTEKDILKEAYAGRLALSIFVNQLCLIEKEEGKAPLYENYSGIGIILPVDAGRFVFAEYLELKEFIGADGRARLFAEEGVTVKRAIGGAQRNDCVAPLLCDRSRLLVTGEEYLRYLNENPGIEKAEIACGRSVLRPENVGVSSAILRNPQGSRFLTGWKAIQVYLGDVSESTARRYAKAGKWLRESDTGKPTTTTFEVDDWRINTAKKKKKAG